MLHILHDKSKTMFLVLLLVYYSNRKERRAVARLHCDFEDGRKKLTDDEYSVLKFSVGDTAIFDGGGGGGGGGGRGSQGTPHPPSRYMKHCECKSYGWYWVLVGVVRVGREDVYA